MRLCDPGPGELAAPPRHERDWGVMASGRIALGLDNLSTIRPWMSDAICRAVTGDAMAGRTLYTNDSISVLSFRLALVLTSIDPGGLAGDLADRMLPITLQPLGNRRQSEEHLMAELDRLAPTLLGAVFDLVSVALAQRPKVSPPEEGWPRMADFAHVVAALDQAEGNGKALTRYLDVVAGNEGDSVAEHPLFGPLDELLRGEDNGHWEGTATQLLDEFGRNGLDRLMDFRTPERLGAELNRMQKGLRRQGIDMTRRKIGSKRLIAFELRET